MYTRPSTPLQTDTRVTDRHTHGHTHKSFPPYRVVELLHIRRRERGGADLGAAHLRAEAVGGGVGWGRVVGKGSDGWRRGWI